MHLHRDTTSGSTAIVSATNQSKHHVSSHYYHRVNACRVPSRNAEVSTDPRSTAFVFNMMCFNARGIYDNAR